MKHRNAAERTKAGTTGVTPGSKVGRAVLISGLVSCLVGASLLVHIAVTADPPVSLETTAGSGELTARLDYYEWIGHDHNKHSHDDDGDDAEIDGDLDLNPEFQEGFVRPASMMPGTPDEGFTRLQIELQLENISGPAAEVSPWDFFLEDEEGARLPGLHGGTFTATSLGTGQALNTVIAFDVEDSKAGADMELIWVWKGQETRFAVTGSDHH